MQQNLLGMNKPLSSPTRSKCSTKFHFQNWTKKMGFWYWIGRHRTDVCTYSNILLSGCFSNQFQTYAVSMKNFAFEMYFVLPISFWFLFSFIFDFRSVLIITSATKYHFPFCIFIFIFMFIYPGIPTNTSFGVLFAVVQLLWSSSIEHIA